MLMMAEHPSLNLQANNRLCTTCRREVSKLPAETRAEGPSDDISASESESESSLESEDTGSDWEKSEESGSLTAKKHDEKEEGTHDGEEIIQQLKEKFNSTTKKNEKLTILTVLPKSWSIAKVTQVFGTTKYMARRAKKLVGEKGIFCSPDPKKGKRLPKNILEEVKNFYLSDSISKEMPGKKDVISVKAADGVKVHRQKRILLTTLKEVYAQFKLLHPEMKIGLSSFINLRPKECILTRADGKSHC